MDYGVIIRGAIIFPSLIMFLYLIVELSADFKKALNNCNKPLLVRTFPFLFFINSFFTIEGLKYRNKGLIKLLISILLIVIALCSLMIIEGEWSI